MDEYAFKSPVIQLPPYLIEVSGIGFVRALAGEFIPVHRHQTHEILFVLDGEIKMRIGKRNADVLKNQAVLIKPGDAHYQYYITGTEVFFMKLAITEWDIKAGPPAARSQTEDHPLAPILKCGSRVFTGSADICGQVGKIRDRTIRDIHARRRMAAADLGRLVRSFGGCLALQKSPDYALNKQGLELLGGPDRQKIQKALRYFAHHYTESINLARLAGEAYLGLRQFERLFKKALGISPSQYLMEKRIQRTLQLLRRTDLKIESIIAAAGFKNRGHFFRLFAQRTGLSPQVFRKNLMAGRPDFLRISPLTR